MCDPITLTAVAVGLTAVGTGVGIQQGVQARKAAKTQARGQIAEAEATARRTETKRQQGILQQQKDQAQIAKKLSSNKMNMLARYNINQAGTQQSGNILGMNQLAGTNTEKLA